MTPKTQTVTSDTSVGGVRSLNLWDVKGLLLTPDISYGDVSSGVMNAQSALIIFQRKIMTPRRGVITPRSGVMTLYQSVKISQTVSLLGVKKKTIFFHFYLIDKKDIIT